MKKINIKPIIFIILIVVVFLIGSSYAYYYSEVSLPNQFRTMTYDIVLEEEFYNEWGTKKVKITNKESTSTPVVLRINYNEIWSHEENGHYLTLSNKVNGVDTVTKEWTDEFINDFIEDEDGWYYYNKVLGPEESVLILSSIELNIDTILSSEYEDKYFSNDYSYELSFNYEAIQADEDAVKEIWDKDITISDGDIVW